jgi:uncharacterized membrane protein YesL
MIRFLMKKTFFNTVDNLVPMVLMNLGYLVLVVAGMALEYAILYVIQVFVQDLPMLPGLALGHFIFLPVVCFFFVYTGAVSCMTRDMADNKNPRFKDFITYLKQTWKPSLVFGILNFVLLFVLLVASIYYLGAMENLLNPLIFFFLAWLFVFWIAAAQYFFPLQSMFNKSLKKNIKKMFLLLLDNTAFTLFILLPGAILLLGLSALTLFVLFSFSTVLLWYNTALKLRMYKYEYLEQNPGAGRRKIPWSTLLADEKKLLGHRSLRGVFFPDKD